MRQTKPLGIALLGAALSVTPAASAGETHVEGKNFKLDTFTAPCTVGAECTVVVKLEAVGEYHINKSFPHKFKAKETAGIEFLGKDPQGPHVFSKAAGDFVEEGEKVAKLTIRFKPSAKGPLTLTGHYKLSVCSAQNCQLETQEFSIVVPVK